MSEVVQALYEETSVAELENLLGGATQDDIGEYLISALWTVAEVMGDILEAFGPDIAPPALAEHLEKAIGPLVAIEVAAKTITSRQEIVTPTSLREVKDGNTQSSDEPKQ